MFNDALSQILKFEGGYSNDPDDPGGATNFGITQSLYDPTLKKNVKDITKPEVEKLYWIIWRQAGCDKIDSISPKLAEIHFDCAVNCGAYQANKLLQDVLQVKIDGVFGPQTLSKIKDSLLVRKLYLDRRKQFYDSLIKQKPKLAKFKKSWYSRLRTFAKKDGFLAYEN